MKNKVWKILFVTGTMLILSALFLCLYNYRQSNNAYDRSQEILAELKNEIPQSPENAEDHIKPEEDLFKEYEESTITESSPIEIDGQYYCGYVTLPSLGLELPVLNEWSYPNLKIAPCRYSGSAQNNDLIIAAHNYSRHFGQIKDLTDGDAVIFTGCNGVQYYYSVSYTEYIDGYNVDKMLDSDGSAWDMTLFTCTLSGQSRVTVRAQQEHED